MRALCRFRVSITPAVCWVAYHIAGTIPTGGNEWLEHRRIPKLMNACDTVSLHRDESWLQYTRPWPQEMSS